MTNSKLILLSVLFIFLSSCSKESKISMTAMFEINSKNYSQTLQNNILKAGQAYRDFSKPLIPQNLTVGGVNYKISKLYIAPTIRGTQIRFQCECLERDNELLTKSKKHVKQTLQDLNKQVCDILNIDYSKVVNKNWEDISIYN